jgi:hypothetical protein
MLVVGVIKLVNANDEVYKIDKRKAFQDGRLVSRYKEK